MDIYAIQEEAYKRGYEAGVKSVTDNNVGDKMTPTDRERLIKLLCDVIETDGCSGHCNYPPCYLVKAIADHLIANGVVISKNETTTRWIPVTERLPELHTKVLCCGVKGGRFIAELTTWGKEAHLIWDKRNGRGCPTVTHWMPLPEPPKGE